MRHRWQRLGTIAAVLVVLVVVAGWPASLGGVTSYVSTRGVSMEPGISHGDLVAVRQAGDYRIGDVVAYRSATLGTTVLHRIVDEDDQGFITQGDNNDFLDPDRPVAATILGRQWIHVPGAGRLIGVLRTAVPPLVGGLMLLGAQQVKRRRGRRPSHAAPSTLRSPSSLRTWRLLTLAGGGIAVAMLTVGLLAFGRPASQLVESRLDYHQRGTFAYGAAAPPGPVYGDGRVETGDTLFLQLVDQLDVTFDYDFESAGAEELEGTLAVDAVLTNTSGWRHEVELQPTRAFADDDQRADVRLDVRRLQEIVDQVALATGMPAPQTAVAVVPSVSVTGTVGGHPLTEQFSPRLEFVLDDLQLRPAVVGDGANDAIEPTTSGTITTTSSTARHFVVLSKRVPVGTVRTLALTLGLPATIAAAAGITVLQRRLEGEAARIELRHGHRIVPVESKVADVIEVKSIQDLARMAEQYQALILQRHAEDGTQEYRMHADGVTYRYSTKPDRPIPSRLLG